MASTGFEKSRKASFEKGSDKANQSRKWFLLLLFAGMAGALSAQTLTTLVTFNGPNGASPYAPLIQGADQNLYGTTYSGGSDGSGTVFKMTPAGKLTTLYNFCPQAGCADGSDSSSPLVQGRSGEFYGTSTQCCFLDYGTVFKMTPAGKLTTIYTFCAQPGCSDGQDPVAGLIQATNGDLYGATLFGGTTTSACVLGCGTLFKMTPSGQLTTLYRFCSESGCADAAKPVGELLQAKSGLIYGATSAGGAHQGGTIFTITPSGSFVTLYSFCSQSGCADGLSPLAGVIQAADGAFYGTTYGGGANHEGTIFKISPSGKLTTLYSFCSQTGCPDGSNPRGGVIQAADGNLYGTTSKGGTASAGTIFQITPGGTLTTLYQFCTLSQCADGGEPQAGLVQAANGLLYGTTLIGGPVGGIGTIFSLALP